MTIRDWPVDERPREKLLLRGAAALSDAELLAILLRTGTSGQSAVDVARDVLSHFQSLRQLIAADRVAFCARSGLSLARYAELQAAMEIARRRMGEVLRTSPLLSSPAATREYLASRLRDLEHELFCCLLLDKRHRLIHFEELFRGTLDSASVYPREVVKLALRCNAAAVILATTTRPALPSPATPTSWSPAASARRWHSSTSASSTTSSWAKRAACRWRKAACSDVTRFIPSVRTVTGGEHDSPPGA